MAVQSILWLAKRYPSNLISVFLTGFRYFSYQVATQLSSQGWVDPVPDPILPEKILGYSRELNPGPLGWQSDMLTTIPKGGQYINVAIIISNRDKTNSYISDIQGVRKFHYKLLGIVEGTE